jgi:hypothetical protein
MRRMASKPSPVPLRVKAAQMLRNTGMSYASDLFKDTLVEE